MEINKDDLISRAKLLNDLSYCAPELWQDEEYIKTKIMKQPVVDAVPVVRCQYCKFNHGINEECGCNGGYHSEDWYCADGKRKDDEASIFDTIPPERLKKLMDEYAREQIEEIEFMSLLPRQQEEHIEY